MPNTMGLFFLFALIVSVLGVALLWRLSEKE